jgi:putative ABC transport system permease protein
VLAGVAGTVVSVATFRVLTAALPLGALAESAVIDWRLAAAAMLIALLAAVTVAVIPSISLWRSDLRGRLSNARTGGVGGRGGRMENGLVIAEVAIAVLMASGAALLIRSAANLRAIDPGVDTAAVAVLDIATGSNLTPDERRRLFTALPPALQAVPGVRSAAIIQMLPLRGPSWNFGIRIEGEVEQTGPSTTLYRIVTPGYFETMGIGVQSGRTFLDSDAGTTEALVVINRALAATYFRERDPIGRRISTGFNAEWARIIGVVENAADGNLTMEATPTRYMLQAQNPFVAEMQSVVLRVAPGLDPTSVLDEARAVVQRVTPTVAVQTTTTMDRVFAQAMGPTRQITFLLVLLAGLALVLGAVGVYGVVTQFVRRLQRDWSIRMALGLRPGQVVTRIVTHGGLLVAGGILIGLMAAFASTRVLASLLYGVGAADPAVMAMAVAVVLAAGLSAAFVPALRASRADPARVLREQ